MPREAVLGVDLGATNMRVAVVTPEGEIVSRAAQPTPPDDPGALPRLMIEVASKGSEELRGAVVGVPAVVDYDNGVAGRMPNLSAWEGHLAAQPLADACGLPCVLVNDADLAAVGEHRYGAGRGTDDMVYLTISTGIGGGVVIGGRLLHGKRSLAEVGQTTIGYRELRTLESLAAGPALERLSGLSGAEVTRLAQAGDAAALGWLREIAGAIAGGVADAIESYMPERVVIGGGVASAGPLLLDPLRERLAGMHTARLLDPSRVVPASGGDDAGLRGAWPLWEYASTREAGETLAPRAPSADGN
ncbi:MAG: ROK family protein [Chloroflexi bacterium]|nr:ROK family protein [Chloroflexota bacterium]